MGFTSFNPSYGLQGMTALLQSFYDECGDGS